MQLFFIISLQFHPTILLVPPLLNRDLDAAALSLLLWNEDTEETVLHGSFDSVVVDWLTEGEDTREGADTALRNPVLGGRLWWLLDLLLALAALLNSCTGGFLRLILDGRLVTLNLLCLSTVGWFLTRGVLSLDLAANVQGLGVSELDLDIFLFNAGELAVEFVAGLDLANIELGIEGASKAGALGALTTITVLVGVEVVKKTEERVEGWRGGVVVTGDECSWEDRHFGFGGFWKKC